MKDTVQEFLKPRYRVIADYPNTSFEIGDVLDATDDGSVFENNGYEIKAADYKAIFKPLAWWEERRVDEMPPCLKTENGHVYRVKWYAGEITENGLQPMRFDINEESQRHWAVISNIMCFYEPATAKDFQQYLNSLK